MPTLTSEFLDKVVDYGRNGIPKDEVLKGYSLVWEALNETEQVYFDEQYNYGRLDGVHRMTDILVQQARAKGGYPACIAFLQQFSLEWKKSKLDGDGSEAAGIFNFGFVKGQIPAAEEHKAH